MNFNDYLGDGMGINPYGTGQLGDAVAPAAIKKKKTGAGYGWQAALQSGLQGAQGGGGLIGAGASIGKDFLINKYVKGGAMKALLGFL